MEIYEAAFECGPDPIIVVDAGGVILRANPEAERAFRFQRHELDGKSVDALIPERLAAGHAGKRAGFMSAPGIRPMGSGIDLAARRSDGSEFPIDIMLSTADTSRGKVAIAVLRDLTESRKVRTQLEEAQQRVHMASEAVGIGYWTYDGGTDAFWCDPICARLFGGRPEDFPKGDDARARIIAEDREERKRKALLSIEAHGVFESEFRVRHPDGDVHWLRDMGRTVGTGTGGTGNLFVGVTYDITARKQAELLAAAAHRRERALFEQAADGIFLADLDGRYLDVNSAGCEMLGMGREEILGKTVMDLVAPEEHARLDQAKQKQLQGRNVVEEWHLIRKDGTRITTEISAQIFPDGRWQAFVRDITERKLAEARQAELVRKLQDALNEVKELKGLLPICSHCKKIRDDQNRWLPMEVYIHSHTRVDFSHGICPDCAREYYSEFLPAKDGAVKEKPSG
jgi:PAS domain S-box-containing protein